MSEGFSSTTFTGLFRLEAWLCIIMMFIILSLVFNKFQVTLEKSPMFEVGMMFMYPIRMLCSQGSEQNASCLPTRIVLIISLTASLVLNASYSANLTSYLFNKKVPVPFTNLEDLKETSYLFGTIDGSVYTDTILAVCTLILTDLI